MDDRKKKNFLFGCLITISLFAIVIVILANIRVTPLKVYRDPQFHFTLKYPSYWGMVPRPENGAALVQFFAPDSSQFDEAHENVNITVQNIGLYPKMRDLNFFSRETSRQLLGTFGDYVTPTEQRYITIAGQPGYRFSYVTTAATAATGSKIKYLHVWFIRGDLAFILTYMGSGKEFDQGLRHVDRMVKTFKFEE